MQVTLVGAGSYDFCGPLLRSLYPVAVRHGLRLVLCDLDAAALDDMAAIAARLAAEGGHDWAVQRSTTLEEAVAEADFVTLTTNHGGLAADLADFANARDHGFWPKHIDTIGPAGWLRALRMGALTRRLVSAMPPQAWLFDLSNPLAFILRLADRAGVRSVGFCHGPVNRAHAFAEWLGLPELPVPTVFGNNHLAWLTELRLGDRDVLPALRDFLAASPEHRGWRFNLELLDHYGTMPILEAQHCGDFFGGLNDEATLAAYGLHLWDGESRRPQGAERARRRRAMADGTTPVADLRPSAEGVAEVIEALLGGEPHRGIHNAPLATPANGMPVGAIAEGWLTVDSAGPHFDPPPALPPALQEQLARIAQQQDLAAQACWSGNLELFCEALCLEPNLPDEETARSLLARALRERPELFPDDWLLWAPED